MVVSGCLHLGLWFWKVWVECFDCGREGALVFSGSGIHGDLSAGRIIVGESANTRS